MSVLMMMMMMMIMMMIINKILCDKNIEHRDR